MLHDAFISYSTHDKAAADAACAALESSGIRCWIAPRDITPGAEWGAAIVEGINDCRVMILIFSANANDSPQIRREVERAVNKGIPIIPLRIQDIAPAHSLQYFIGNVHWLDALTPPLEAHLRRLVESVKTLLQINPAPPRIVVPSSAAAASVASSILPGRLILVTIVLAFLGLSAAGIGLWWLVAVKTPRPELAAPSPAPSQPLPQAVAKIGVDPALIGIFEHDSVFDDYDWRFIDSIAADGTYRLITTQEESGTYQGARGAYRTVGAKTGRVRTGTYRAVGSTAIAITNVTGTVVFRPTQPTPPLDQTNPAMLGIWQATIVKDGTTWTLTVQNNADGTYHFQGWAEDNGSCAFTNQQWRTTSAVTGRSNTGTYRVVDTRNVEITGPNGLVVWQRQ
jgi:TIR domain